MAMIAYLHRLFSYDDWANREVLTTLRALKDSPPRSVKLLSHIISAERLWLERLRQQNQTYPVWPEFRLETCGVEIKNLREFWKDYLDHIGEHELSSSVTYKNTKGEDWTNLRQDILMHVIMHSAYHRGQIASDLRSAGHTPPYTDFIHGVRQGLVE
jgi:uncharacterized damage-inducible protein DinB